MRKKYRDQTRQQNKRPLPAAIDFGEVVHYWHYSEKFDIWLSRCGLQKRISQLATPDNYPVCQNCQRWINGVKVGQRG